MSLNTPKKAPKRIDRAYLMFEFSMPQNSVFSELLSAHHESKTKTAKLIYRQVSKFS